MESEKRKDVGKMESEKRIDGKKVRIRGEGREMEIMKIKIVRQTTNRLFYGKN